MYAASHLLGRVADDDGGPGDVLGGAGLVEDRVVEAEGVGLAGGHLVAGLDVALQAVQLPAGVSRLQYNRTVHIASC